MTVNIPASAVNPRRVRLSRHVMEQVGRMPRPVRVALIEYPRVSSVCEGRAPVWEWRLDRAFSLDLSSR